MRFCCLIFKNRDLFKFARSFLAMLTSQSFYFVQASIRRLILNIQTSLVGCAANRAQLSET